MVQGAFCFGEAKGNFEPRMARMDTNVEGNGVNAPDYRGRVRGTGSMPPATGEGERDGVNAPDYREMGGFL